MRNAISFLKHYRVRLGLSSRAASGIRPSPILPVLLLLAAVGLPPGVAVGIGEPAFPSAVGQDDPSLAMPGRPSPELTAVLLPRHVPPGTYRVTTLDLPIEAARRRTMAALAPGSREGQPPGAWEIQRVDPLAAFGEGGLYDRSRLARLYSGKPASVLHAPIARNGRVVASLTLISPYPDARLERLAPGTLAILFVADAARPAK